MMAHVEPPRLVMIHGGGWGFIGTHMDRGLVIFLFRILSSYISFFHDLVISFSTKFSCLP